MTPTDLLSRRGFLAGCAALATAPALAAGPGDAPRIASLDYGLANTAMALGVTPVGLAAAAHWKDWVVEPPLPRSVVDIGRDREVNLELLASLRPELILATPYVQALRSRLEDIAPVLSLAIYTPDGNPLERSYAAARSLGERLGREREARQFLDEADAFLADCAARVARAKPGPALLINFMDSRHARVYGAQGLYQDVLDRIGVTNAWDGPTTYWGFQTIGLEQLATKAGPDTTIIAFEPIPGDVEPTLAQSPLWTQLPPIAEGRYAVLPSVLTFGTVPAALRFAQLFTDHVDPEGRR
ncbi:ABC transporter substrate-binding protein [Amorphus coralli]|uniref:ABC transporter substrate-binding protein n=1 Tax=Amorphus coralli TaxID=340680 RepID=UPI000376AAF0|nr:ABC transporter substrate-binding protein [Amorphus coralli]